LAKVRLLGIGKQVGEVGAISREKAEDKRFNFGLMFDEEFR